jgi:hypothetical protein
LVLIGCWLWTTNQWSSIFPILQTKGIPQQFWWIALGYLLNTMPLGVFIGFITRKWTDELTLSEENETSEPTDATLENQDNENPNEEASNEEPQEPEKEEEKLSHKVGLKNAGRYIGMLERVLIFTFIIMSQPQAIGFLIAAKSVFRFGDLNDSQDRKKTEYILIGTLLSFTCSFIVGLLIKYFMER